ncbi:MAG: C4-type zinc ribbon domain-containing protein [Chloroflexi bacterium]|jgi:predicted  nucleic acid-binding Zn-ribbon protein|nr:C4-type zinc ribbon domain-containing protein [Chloroflexota bacterium]
MSRVSSLHRLQEIDLSIDRARARLAEVEKLLGASDTVRAARASHDQAQARLDAAEASVRDAELAAATQRAKLENAERSLYSGGVHNPKELQGLQADVDSLRRHMSSLEDCLLEAMVALEDVEARARQAAGQLDQAEAAQVTEEASLAGERSQLQARLATLDTEREAALAGVAEKDLALYARLRDSMGGRALATLQDGSCGACGVGISAGERQTVRNSAELFRCPQCGRILYAG